MLSKWTVKNGLKCCRKQESHSAQKFVEISSHWWCLCYQVTFHLCCVLVA